MTHPAIELLRRTRLPLDDEKRCQVAMAETFAVNRIPYLRELPLYDDRGAPLGIIDFLLPEDGLGIEVKINKGQASDIRRQIVRYGADTRITHMVLASAKAVWLPVLLITGKPVTFVDLGRAWL